MSQSLQVVLIKPSKYLVHSDVVRFRAGWSGPVVAWAA